ncbi:N-acyl homoserine lactonase family protein [Lapidilactobacillus wuchangensis]|uniref:N-acyl homoserine lactonase family protein n=1 Tax=Lapidilactobacillus wuchangensis TaxID=2486001 RepID=UPI000F76A30E|nr:N-acyl homoserine lactonase family protein [Lapidilactobacillus wuchangensis]
MVVNHIRIHVLHTGLVQVDRALPFHGQYRNPLAFTGLFRSAKNKIILPVSSYLIEHPRGLVLIDTGWNKTIRQSNWQELGTQTQINTGYLPAGWAVDERLANLGYRPEDLDYVLMSHLHCDHASGLQLIKNAPKIMVSASEWQIANRLPLVYLPKEWQGVKIQTYQYQHQGVGPFGEAWDVFDDGSLLQIATPGHASGMSTTLVRGRDGRYVLLAADVGYSQTSWEQMITPGICTSRKKAITSLGWLGAMAQDPACLKVLVNHDPQVPQQVIDLPA